MIFWKFEIFEECPGPIFQKPAKNGVLKMPPFVRFYFFKNPQKMVFEKIQIFEQLPGSRIPLLAIHTIISHIWEDAPRTVNNDEPDLRFFTETFDLLSAGQFENLVFRPQSQGGQICVSWAHPLEPGLGPPTWARLRRPKWVGCLLYTSPSPRDS